MSTGLRRVAYRLQLSVWSHWLQFLQQRRAAARLRVRARLHHESFARHAALQRLFYNRIAQHHAKAQGLGAAAHYRRTLLQLHFEQWKELRLRLQEKTAMAVRTWVAIVQRRLSRLLQAWRLGLERRKWCRDVADTFSRRLEERHAFQAWSQFCDLRRQRRQAKARAAAVYRAALRRRAGRGMWRWRRRTWEARAGPAADWQRISTKVVPEAFSAWVWFTNMRQMEAARRQAASDVRRETLLRHAIQRIRTQAQSMTRLRNVSITLKRLWYTNLCRMVLLRWSARSAAKKSRAHKQHIIAARQQLRLKRRCFEALAGYLQRRKAATTARRMALGHCHRRCKAKALRQWEAERERRQRQRVCSKDGVSSGRDSALVALTSLAPCIALFPLPCSTAFTAAANSIHPCDG